MFLVWKLHCHLREQHRNLIYIFRLQEVRKRVDNLHQSTAPVGEASLSFSDLIFRSCDDPPRISLLNEQGPTVPFQSNLVDRVRPL